MLHCLLMKFWWHHIDKEKHLKSTCYLRASLLFNTCSEKAIISSLLFFCLILSCISVYWRASQKCTTINCFFDVNRMEFIKNKFSWKCICAIAISSSFSIISLLLVLVVFEGHIWKYKKQFFSSNHDLNNSKNSIIVSEYGMCNKIVLF